MIATLAATGLIAAFMQTIVTPIIPELPQLLDTTTADASWVLTATLLAGARIHVAGFDADFGVTGTVGQDSADDASAFVTIGRGF